MPTTQRITETHAILTCYDTRLDPMVEIYRQPLVLDGPAVLHPIRPIGGLHAMTRSACRHFFYDQLDGLILVGQATHIHIFPHTNCQYGWLKVRDKVGETFEQDLGFQIDMLKKSCSGAAAHINHKFPEQHISIIGHIIWTQEKRFISLTEALDILGSHQHKHVQHSQSDMSHSARIGSTKPHAELRI